MVEVESVSGLRRGGCAGRAAGEGAARDRSELLDDFERLVDEDSWGDPESSLLWTAKSVRR